MIIIQQQRHNIYNNTLNYVYMYVHICPQLLIDTVHYFLHTLTNMYICVDPLGSNFSKERKNIFMIHSFSIYLRIWYMSVPQLVIFLV